jgi:hypothetical protein
MKTLSKLAALGSTLLCLSSANATSVPNTDTPTTFLGPTVRLGYTSSMTDTSAYSLAGEAGLRNFRIGGTLGWKLADNQRFKISAEYLWQKINFAFFSGDSEQWVNQGALGAAYQYDLEYPYHPQFDLSAYISYAPSKTLSTVSGTYLDPFGNTVFYNDHRRIAGSNSNGISPGITISPWTGGKIGAELNYDNVRYDTDNSGINEDAKGLGGTIKIGQIITDNVSVNVAAAVRQPFNNYAADLNFDHIQYYGDWTLGLFGDYNVGKNTLPDTWNVGISADYFLDQRAPHMVSVVKGERDIKAERIPQPISDTLLAWTANPAVYMPQVLAIADSSCNGIGNVRVVMPIPNPPVINTSGVFTFNSPTHFSGNNLIYSMSVVPVSGSDIPPPDQLFSINKSTGAVTLDTTSTGANATYAITVTAANGCSSVSTTFDVTINND